MKSPFYLMLLTALLSSCSAQTNSHLSQVDSSKRPVTMESISRNSVAPLAYAYDRLSGERNPSCLDETSLEVFQEDLRSSFSDFTIISSKEELARKLRVEVNAEASTSYGLFSASVSSKTEVLSNANFNEKSLVGLFSFVYKDARQSLERERLSSEATELLESNPKLFRYECSDAYAKASISGAAIYLVVNLKTKDEDSLKSLDTINSVKAAFGNIFSAQTSTQVSKESKQTLANLSISMSCHSLGIKTDACANSLVTIDPSDISGLVEYVDKAKKTFSSSVENAPERFVIIEEELEDYPKPIEYLEAKYFDVFYDYTKQLRIVRDLLAKESILDERCFDSSEDICLNTRRLLARQIKNCSMQQLWPDCAADSVSLDGLPEFDIYQPGRVLIWENFYDGRLGGKKLVLDFNRTAGSRFYLKEGQVYNIRELDYPQDLATGYRSGLSKGYQLRLFEHENGLGSCFIVGAKDNRTYSFEWFNDKASSFRLERVGEFPTNCD